jgi:glyoxylase-like metal-dependent hydrolase (beta-lactamase superfamily II)
VVGTPGYIAPNTFVSMERETEMTLAGYRFLFFRTGGEAASHIGVYLPDQKIVFTGDEIQGPTFPQLHSLRGTRPRDIQRWVGAMDRMRAYDVEYLVPSHGRSSRATRRSRRPSPRTATRCSTCTTRACG